MATPSPNDVFYSAYQASLITEDEIRELAAAAFARIQTGEGQVKVNSGWGQAGKSFSFLSDLTPTELLAAAAYALRLINPNADGRDSMVEFPRFQ